MDWRDSNIVLGEQMNTRGYDASTLLPSHKGVGILRPDGETDAGDDAVALTVRTFFMQNVDWRTLYARGRVLRQAAGTLAGHAIGDDAVRAIDRTSVVKPSVPGRIGRPLYPSRCPPSSNTSALSSGRTGVTSCPRPS